MFGGDPEVFLFRERRPVPAHEMDIPPKEGAVKTTSGEFFRDGYAVEFNPNPSIDFKTVGANFNRLVLSFLNIGKAKGWKDIRLIPTPWTRINLMKDIWEGPSDVRAFGCNPSYDAYKPAGKNEKRFEISATSFPFRSTGGHIHITANSFVKSPLTNPEDYPMVVKLWDIYVGVPITFLLEEGRKRPFSRRRIYGRAGEYRPQVHGAWKGLEYRVLGPEVWFHEPSRAMVFSRMEWVVKNFDRLSHEFSEEKSQTAAEYINTGKPALARQLIEDQPNFSPAIRFGWGRPNLSLEV